MYDQKVCRCGFIHEHCSLMLFTHVHKLYYKWRALMKKQSVLTCTKNCNLGGSQFMWLDKLQYKQKMLR